MPKRLLAIPALLATVALTLGVATTRGSYTATYHTTAHTRLMRPSARPGSSGPYTGVLQLTINPDGIINGRYTGNSIQPDPFYGKIITVTGGREKGKSNFWISIGMRGNLRLTGHFTHDGFTASGYDRHHRLWDVKGELARSR